MSKNLAYKRRRTVGNFASNIHICNHMDIYMTWSTCLRIAAPAGEALAVRRPRDRLDPSRVRCGMGRGGAVGMCAAGCVAVWLRSHSLWHEQLYPNPN